jgi:DeoR/GlpR family transcriptional regulator of sugar metabolism
MHEHARTGRLGAERRAVMLAVLARDGKLVASRLVEELGVSEDTVRRDLRDLAARGLVQRVHGGALPPAPQPGTFAHRSETATAEKAAIARAVADLVADARVLLMDGSTTNLEVARLLPGTRVGTILTNSPPIAAALADHPALEVVVIGGRMDKRAQVTVGATAVDAIRGVRADACVLGVCALHPEVGLTTDDLDEAEVKRAMVLSSGEVIAPATSDKLRAASAYLVAPVDEVTHIVAEPGATDDLLDPYRALGVSVLRA